MHAKKIILGLSGIVIIGGAVLAWLSARERKMTERELAHAVERQAELRAELRRLTQMASAAPAKPAAAAEAGGASGKGEKTAEKEETFPPRIRAPGLMDFARENPQLLNDFIHSKQAEFGRSYLPLCLWLNLSPDQQARMNAILAASVARGMDIGAAADAQGLAYEDPVIKVLREESIVRRKAELMELLGEAGFREFDLFERALPVRGFLDGLAVQVATRSPLSGQQADRMERVLANASPSYLKGNNADPKELDWEIVDRQAREILTPEQFALWQQGGTHNKYGGSRRSHELERAYQRAVKRARGESGS
ncbi:MAG: hypothetical protein V4773_02685 [Verrucomicrobiota bacterium]